MIYIIFSSRLILIILVASVLSILIETSVALPTNVAIAATKNDNKVAVDKIGITEIYPTKPNGGREWYVNKSSPLNDNNFFLSPKKQIPL